MKAARLVSIFRALRSHGLVVQQLRRNLWLIPVPETLDKIWMVNQDGFNPHEMRETIKVARCVILGWSKHEEPSLDWKPTGAVYWVVNGDDDVIRAFRDVDFDVTSLLGDLE